MPDVCPTTGKTGYGSKAAASKAKASLLKGRRSRTGRGELQVFKCVICGDWHLGHHMRRRAA